MTPCPGPEELPEAAEELRLLGDDDLDALVEVAQRAPVPRAPRDPFDQFRRFHGWTLDKLDVLEKYFKIYRRVAGSGTYIDAFAGTGYGRRERPGGPELLPGSAIVALNSGAFRHHFLIEKDDACRAKLTEAVTGLPERFRDRAHVLPGNCNDVVPQLLLGGSIDPDRPCFALLDQESTQLSWSTVASLAAYKRYKPPESSGNPQQCKVELWILFNVESALTRMWPIASGRHLDPIGQATLDRVMGGREVWRELWDDRRPASDLLQRYVERLQALGYMYVSQQPFKNRATGRIQYRMVHATDHPSAESLMMWAKKVSSAGPEPPRLPGFDPNP